MVFEDFEFAGLEEGDRLWKLEVGSGFWRGRCKLLGTVGANDGEPHQIGSD